MRRLLLLTMLLATLVACGSPARGAGAGGCGSKDSDQIRTLVTTQLQVWDDANRLAAGTSRIAIAPQIAELQRIRRETQAQAYPTCGRQVQSSFVAMMGATIETYLAFQSQQPDATVEANAQAAADRRADFERSLTAVGGTAAALVPTATAIPTATITPTPTATLTPRPPTATATLTPTPGVSVASANGQCSITLPFPMARTSGTGEQYATADNQIIAIIFGWPSQTIDTATDEARGTLMAAFPGYKQANYSKGTNAASLTFTGWVGDRKADATGSLHLRGKGSSVCGFALVMIEGGTYDLDWATNIMLASIE